MLDDACRPARAKLNGMQRTEFRGGLTVASNTHLE